jgi:heme exporter protein A
MKHETRNSDAQLRIEGLACSRGERRLFSGFDLTLAAGEAVQIAGANGCGKTTLLRTVCGLQRPGEGSVSWNGCDVHRDADKFAGACLYLAHENALNPDLTPRENLAALTRLHGDRSGSGEIEEALTALEVAALADRPCRHLSAGQRRRAALARLRLSRAPLWLLDEPAAALDAEGRTRLGDCIAGHADGGGAVLFTTHEPLRVPGIAVRTVGLPV